MQNVLYTSRDGKESFSGEELFEAIEKCWTSYRSVAQYFNPALAQSCPKFHFDATGIGHCRSRGGSIVLQTRLKQVESGSLDGIGVQLSTQWGLRNNCPQLEECIFTTSPYVVQDGFGMVEVVQGLRRMVCLLAPLRNKINLLSNMIQSCKTNQHMFDVTTESIISEWCQGSLERLSTLLDMDDAQLFNVAYRGVNAAKKRTSK